MRHLQEHLPEFCKSIETILAVFVGLCLLAYTFHLVFMTDLIIGLLNGHTEFAEVLEAVFSVVIGIEFIEMLCRPDSQTVLEVLIFLIARHIIIETPSPLGLFVLVIAVCLLCIVRRALHLAKIRTLDLEDQFEEHERNHKKEAAKK